MDIIGLNAIYCMDWDWKSLGVLVLSLILLVPLVFFNAVPAVYAEDTNSTATTTTTSTINWDIDVAPLINLVVSLLPAVLVIVIIKAVLGSLGGFARLARLKAKIGSWFSGVKANSANVKWSKVIPALAFLAMIVAGVAFGVPGAAAEESTTASIDVNSMINLVMSLLPLIIVLVIIKAIMGAFKGLG